MTREEKIEAIYKEMANKECSFGCRYILQDEFKSNIFFEAIESEGLGCTKWDDDICKIDDGDYEYSIHKIKEIIGHPVMIGTIFERYSANKGFINSQFVIALIDKWTGYDRSIEDQSDECIDYVYSLIQKD